MLIENRKAFGVLFLVAIMGSGCNSSSNEQNEFDPSLISILAYWPIQPIKLTGCLTMSHLPIHHNTSGYLPGFEFLVR
jgi:hypothetical protein